MAAYQKAAHSISWFSARVIGLESAVNLEGSPLGRWLCVEKGQNHDSAGESSDLSPELSNALLAADF
jgi:hypothetical protein